MRVPKADTRCEQDGLVCSQLFDNLSEVCLCKIGRSHGVRFSGVVPRGVAGLRKGPRAAARVVDGLTSEQHSLILPARSEHSKGRIWSSEAAAQVPSEDSPPHRGKGPGPRKAYPRATALFPLTWATSFMQSLTGLCDLFMVLRSLAIQSKVNATLVKPTRTPSKWGAPQNLLNSPRSQLR